MLLTKYLENYAESESQQNFTHIKPAINCLVIPCRDESTDLLSRLKILLSYNPSTLIILVVNQPVSQIDSVLNETLAKAAKDKLANSILVIDRFSDGKCIDDKHGVGLARKIGCDAACQLIAQGIISSQWIHTSDADVSWPHDYFTATAKLHSYAAVIYPFTHQPRSGVSGLPIALYELSLRYYVAGLKYAGSPYSYHSVGSTLAINVNNYAMVRGFPKRSAGEDFHILNKLCKTGDIASLQAPVITIFDRDSNRTPFGTGPAVSKLSAMQDATEEYLYYHPQCFELLKTWLDFTPSLFDLGNTEKVITTLKKTLKPVLVKALLFAKIEQQLNHCFKQAKTNQGFVKQLNDGFDALTTLRLIHYLRDHQYPSIDVKELLTLNTWFTLALNGDHEQKNPLDINQQSITLVNHYLARQ
jgi:hypothetical protein